MLRQEIGERARSVVSARKNNREGLKPPPGGDFMHAMDRPSCVRFTVSIRAGIVVDSFLAGAKFRCHHGSVLASRLSRVIVLYSPAFLSPGLRQYQAFFSLMSRYTRVPDASTAGIDKYQVHSYFPRSPLLLFLSLSAPSCRQTRRPSVVEH